MAVAKPIAGEAEALAYAKTGDLWYLVSLVVSISFAVAVVLYADDPNQTFFDKDWTTEGFCISNRDVPYWNSHDTSFYSDIVMTIVMVLMYFSWGKEPYMQGICSSQILLYAGATIGHGAGHFNIARLMREQNVETVEQDMMDANNTRWQVFVGQSVLFWLPMLKAACTRMPWSLVAGLAVLAEYGMTSIPYKFSFTYVQTVLLAAHAANELTRPRAEKGWEYATFPLFLNVPIALVGWAECLGCSTFYKDIGGHVWYDTTLGCGLSLFYLSCYLRYSSSSGNKQKAV